MKVIIIEGNIATGKSTLLNLIKEYFKENKKVQIIQEPIENWQESKLFKLYYENQKQYSELFQMYAFLSILKNFLKQNYQESDIIFIERSIYSSVNIFSTMLLERNCVRPIFHDMLQNSLLQFKEYILFPNYIFFLKTQDTEINILKQRIMERGRKEEHDISIEYLSHLNKIYNSVINSFKKEHVKIYDFSIHEENMLEFLKKFTQENLNMENDNNN